MKIAVLYGGTSTERDVSLVTGRAVAGALTEVGHDVLLVDPARGDSPIGAKEAIAAAAIGGTPPEPTHETGSALEAIAGAAVSEADVVFVALHGGTGEDGTVQGLLELAGKRYTGSGVLACAVAMDKRASKLMFREAGVPTPDWRVVGDESSGGSVCGGRSSNQSCIVPGAPSFPTDLSRDGASSVVAGLGGYPLVVKPNDQGSTVGLTVVHNESDLPEAIALAARFSRHVLIESFIPGRELTVAVLDGQPLPVVEIVPHGGLYDYESKYTSGRSDYTCPANLTDDVAADLGELALRAYASLGCAGYARVDFRLDDGHEPSCLEVNTVPGMTAMSLVPMAAAAAGMTFPELTERIVRLALR